MKITITLIASGSSFFPKVGCHLFFTSKSVDQKGIFTGLSFFFPRIRFFFPPLWECYLENKSSLGNGRGKTIPVLLQSVHWLLLYQKESSHHHFSLYRHRFKIRGDPTRAIPLVPILAQWLHALFGAVLSLRGRSHSVCLPLPSPDLRQAWRWILEWEDY